MPEQRLRPNANPILINSGDRLRLALNTMCTFNFCVSDLPAVSLTESQNHEIKARLMRCA
jgi:hypothetical protein